MRYTSIPFFLVIWAVHLTGVACHAQSSDAKRIILIGNAFETVSGNACFLDAVRQSVPFDAGTIVLYLGNNISGMDDTGLLRKEAAIIRNSEATAIFIPGYMDWDKGGKDGYQLVKAGQRFLKGLGNDRIKFYPEDGCPGPEKVKLGNDAVMYIMDSQWWLHQSVKADWESGCKTRTREEVLQEIEDIPEDELDKLVLWVMHHPLVNTGIHSGSYGLKQHLFPLTDIQGLRNAWLPLPVAGSLYPVLGNAISSSQDLQHPEYQRLANTGILTTPGIIRTFSEHPHSVFIAGQERNLQLLKKDNHYYINSGAAGRPTRVRNNKEALYVKEKPGFTVLELTAGKKLTATFYVIDDCNARADFSKELIDYSRMPQLAPDTATVPMIHRNATTVPVSKNMGSTSGLTRLLVGENYRKEWSTPVKIKVLHLDKELGGLQITGIGGGHQSHTLQLKDKTGKEWVFRPAIKDLEELIPEGFRATFASDLIQKMLSASHPYGARVVTGLQAPLGIKQAHPRMFFMPNDTLLEDYRPLFANQVGLLEEKKPVSPATEVVSTEEALHNLLDKDNQSINQKSYLKVRLIDFLISDFDRHQGQFSWGLSESKNRTNYFPIPKDRDQAFYNNTGLVMRLTHGAFPYITNFPSRIKTMKYTGMIGAYLDNILMNQLSEPDWRAVLASFKDKLTDAAIDSAVRRLPKEIYAISGPQMSDKLKSRRESIVQKGLDYYAFISKKVTILGGNKADIFRVSAQDEGLLVQVFSKHGNGRPQLRYTRTFDPKVTKELRLYGFDGDDVFEVDPSAGSRIRLRIVGGGGADTFNIRGSVRNHLYDLKGDGNQVLAGSRTTSMFSNNPSVNGFELRQQLYNSLEFPLVTLGYNAEDKVIIGIGLAYRTYGFQKEPFATQQRFAVSFASASNSWMMRYRGEFNHVYRRYDLVVNGDNYNPVLKNFFGYGNESVRDTNITFKYYRTRYNYLSGDVLIRKRFHRDNTFSIAAGPSVYHYWYTAQPNRGRVLEQPQSVGLDSMNVSARKFYAGGKAVFAINTLDNELLPTRGVSWTTDFTALQSVNESASPYTRLLSTLDLYSVLAQPRRLLAAIHIGGAHIFSDSFEYYQALTLGGNNYLRGYRVNRFSGSSMAYGSVELKLKLIDFNAYILKGDFGVVGFNDIGRVWMRGEQSKKWHHGYGGGIYLIPFNSLMISALAGISNEDFLFNFSVGTRLNMVYQGL